LIFYTWSDEDGGKVCGVTPYMLVVGFGGKVVGKSGMTLPARGSLDD
jgi:hypothetical protein